MKGLICLLMLAATMLRASTLTYSYDPGGRLVGLNYGGTTNTILSYDNNGNLLGQSTFVSANPDLSVSEVAAPSTVVLGLTVQYAVSVFNNSAASATGVVVTNFLPADGTFISSSASQGSVARSGGILTWDVGTLAGGTTATMGFSLRATSVGILTNSSTVTGAQSDPDLSNNSSSLLSSVVGFPALTTSALGTSLMVAWPLEGGSSFSIQHADSMISPIDWVPDSISPSINGDFFYVAEPTTNQARFYRLMSAP
jgi:uncharacterized repeat protein (TIGR01451 family)